MNTHFYMSSDPSDMVAQAQALKRGGVSVIRDAFKWDQVQPTPYAWKWQQTDAIMTAAATAGLDVLGVVAYSAPWASSDPSGQHGTMFPPRNTADYAAFAGAIAARYGRGGQFWAAHPDLTARPLFAMEMWNEPSGHSYWGPDPNPAAYLALAKAASYAVKATHPEIKVVVSGDLIEARSDFTFVNWLDQLLTSDPHLGQWADVLSVHPYPNPMNGSPLNDSGDPRLRFDRIALIQHVEAAHGVALPLWLTEIGWSTAGPDAVSTQVQANFLTEAISHGLQDYGPSVQYVFPFSWDKAVAGNANTAFGLRRSDGSPEPAWPAIVQLVQS